MKDKSEEKEAADQFDDYTIYSEGDIEPATKKKIASVIFKAQTFIVFLDEKHNVNWVTNANYGDFAEDFGGVMSRVEFLQSTPDALLSESQHTAFERLMGGAVARVLDDGNSANAHQTLDKAEQYLRIRTAESARRWVISAAVVTCGAAMLCLFLLWAFRGEVQARVGTTAFELMLAAAMGSLGALISMVLRITRLDIDPMAGRSVHYFEGAIRTIAGMAGALLTALAVKANIVLGAISTTDHPLALLLVICIVAGASEQLVPNIIKKVEGTLVVDGSSET